jgi:DNA-binding transcriptional LysR family regulator
LLRAWLPHAKTGDRADLGMRELLRTGALVQLPPGWGEERFPPCAYHPSRQLPPAKVRAFLDFVVSLFQS